MAIKEWSNPSDTTFGLIPSASRRVALVWRRPWNSFSLMKRAKKLPN